MPFEPGKSGNPAGAPKAEKRFKGALIRAFKRLYDDDAQGMEKIAEALIEEALTGNNRTQAIKEIRDTLDGKPAQAIIGGDADDPPIKHTVTVSDKDLITRYLKQKESK